MPRKSHLEQVRVGEQVVVAESEMRGSFGNERDYAHEKSLEVLHLKTTQKFQGGNNERESMYNSQLRGKVSSEGFHDGD
jgi:hypothetical protein